MIFRHNETRLFKILCLPKKPYLPIQKTNETPYTRRPGENPPPPPNRLLPKHLRRPPIGHARIVEHITLHPVNMNNTNKVGQKFGLSTKFLLAENAKNK